jgi:hypothetical protein
LSEIDCRPQIIEWVQSWLRNDAEFLTVEQWFSQGHSHDGGHYNEQGFWHLKIKPGKFVWTPPPSAADVAVEEL